MIPCGASGAGHKGISSRAVLLPGGLAQMLMSVGIRPRTIWPLHRRSVSRSKKKYLRTQFEGASRSYCDTGSLTVQHGAKFVTSSAIEADVAWDPKSPKIESRTGLAALCGEKPESASATPEPQGCTRGVD